MLGPICRVIVFKVHTLPRILAPLCCYTPNINGVAYKQQAFFFTALEVRKCKIMLLVDLVSAESPLPGS